MGLEHKFNRLELVWLVDISLDADYDYEEWAFELSVAIDVVIVKLLVSIHQLLSVVVHEDPEASLIHNVKSIFNSFLDLEYFVLTTEGTDLDQLIARAVEDIQHKFGYIVKDLNSAWVLGAKIIQVFGYGHCIFAFVLEEKRHPRTYIQEMLLELGNSHLLRVSDRAFVLLIGNLEWLSSIDDYLNSRIIGVFLHFFMFKVHTWLQNDIIH